MHFKFILASILIFSVSTFASVTCKTERITAGHATLCASTTIPSHTVSSTTLTCNGHDISINCDLYSRPAKLELKITNPDGQSVSTSTQPELHLVDGAGDGASVRCN